MHNNPHDRWPFGWRFFFRHLLRECEPAIEGLLQRQPGRRRCVATPFGMCIYYQRLYLTSADPHDPSNRGFA
jgi:hypothetical protein